ncbi:MAG: hypothetical protein RIC55_31705 [Pirellulaceae bacterium]
MRRFRFSAAGLLLIAITVAGVLTAPGCIGFTSHVLWWMGADIDPAEFDGLEGQTVAVVCESPDSAYGPDSETEAVAREVEKILRYKVSRITMIRYDQVAAWMDRNGSHEIDFRAIGKGVKADRVVAVKLKSFSVHENTTLYQGKADYELAVYDVASGDVVYDDQEPDFQYPTKDAYHMTEMSEAKFQREFIRWLSADIARRFHSNELPQYFEKERTIQQ